MTNDSRPGGQHFTGRKRARRPKRSVLLVDKLARFMITLGGIGSIVAVSLVGLFLFYVVIPLFMPPSVDEASRFERPGGGAALQLAHVAIDEYLTSAWGYHTNGSVVVRRLDTGAPIARMAVTDSLVPTSWSFPIEGETCLFGFGDGSIRRGRIGYATEFLEAEDVPAALHDMTAEETALLGEGMVQRTRENQFRRQKLEIELDETRSLSDAAIVRVDQSPGTNGPRFAALDARGRLFVREVRERTNLLTGEVISKIRGSEMSLQETGLIDRDPDGALDLPRHVLMTGIGDNVLLAWDDGRLVRILSRDVQALEFVEEVDLVPEPMGKLTALTFQLGKASLVAGDAAGRIRIWYRINPPGTRTADGTALVMARELPPGPAAVTSLVSSARTRMIAAGFADGRTDLYFITSERRLAEVVVTEGEPVVGLAIGPRDDRLLATSTGGVALWSVDAPHPETNFQALMGQVWYEGYNDPEFVWQSSAATDSFEPKYSLVPLIFGTLKATFYSMLFGLPLALVAAIYTSEFMHPRTKARVKPIIEMMASLPSVVLGFLAALVFAPFIERLLPETLSAVVTVPLAFLLGAHVWQLIPRDIQLRHGYLKMPAMVAMVPFGLWLAKVWGPFVERTLFGGDIMAWLDGQIGSGLGAWLFLLLPASALVVAMTNSQLVNPWLRLGKRSWTHTSFAAADLLRFLASTAATLGVALLLGWLLSSAGWDPRGTYVDTYVPRNALIVGVVMGFAIIPIIYTISEDALSAVPDHLRAASLGAGATPWQTAMRVIIPPAMSGLFSATMIGLGRAVGETMIVLMAAGNTPLLELNVFNGFRTLSANIAVELPEAVQNSTHFRTLFLAALTLFIMTFILNTVAEIVRIHFRKKAFEL